MPEFESTLSDRSAFSLTGGFAECPHCDHEWMPDEGPFADDDSEVTKCPKCQKPLLLIARVTVRFYACPEVESA